MAMSIALSEFWTRLVRSGITNPTGCKQLAAAYADANGGTPPTDVGTLAKFLIQEGKLTAFQARSLLSDALVELKKGSYTIREERGTPPLSRWSQVNRIADNQAGFLFSASANDLAGGRAAWLGAHREISAANLQSFELETYGESVLVFSALAAGQCLRDSVGDQAISAVQACQIGIALASALEAMHNRPLIHGAVRLDHVWLTDAGEAILLRDPSGPPTAPTVTVDRAWIDHSDLPWLYAAPEFTNAQQPCNESTDIYSLGCLLFRLAAGKFPFLGDNFQSAIAAHASQTPAVLAEAIAQGEAGDPFYRVLAFALAKSPSSRFASAAQLAGALRAILPLLSKAEPIPVSKTPVAKPASSKTSSVKAPTAKPSKVVAADSPTKELSNDSANQPAGTKKLEATAETKSPPQQPSDTASARSTKSPTVTSTVAESTSTSTTKSSEQKPTVAPTAAQSTSAPEPPPVATAAPTLSPPQQTPSPSVSSPVEERSEPRRPLRQRKKKESYAPIALGALGVVVLLLVIGLLVYEPSDPEPKKRKRPQLPVNPPVARNVPLPDADKEKEAVAATTVSGYTLVTDNKLLFVPPYAADSGTAPLDLLPPGAAVIATVRLADIGQSKLLQSFAPELDGLLNPMAARAGVPRESISRCSLAMHPGKDGWPEVSLAIELVEPVALNILTDQWQVEAGRTPEGVTIYSSDAADADAYFIPSSEVDNVRRFAVGSPQRISEVAADNGAAVLLPSMLQALWEGTSEQADFVVLVTPNFLFADGRELLKSAAPELIAPLKSLLVPDAAGALFLADQSDDRVYLETRLVPSGGVSSAVLLRSLQAAVQSWPGWAEEFIVTSVPDQSWRLLASRMPAMLRFVGEQARFGISQDVAVANAYLPSNAVPQVALATLLAMNTPAGASTEQVAATPSTQPLTIDEMLNRKMTVMFEQESLEFALEAIITAFKQKLPEGTTMPPARILGSDLQLMGITQNQSVRNFSKTDLPFRTVLTDLVLGANPDKTATGPADPKQALIWVVADDPDSPGSKAILITTRQAATDKYELPSEFQSGS
jgi:serine/threonine protein kinase